MKNLQLREYESEEEGFYDGPLIWEEEEQKKYWRNTLNT